MNVTFQLNSSILHTALSAHYSVSACFCFLCVYRHTHAGYVQNIAINSQRQWFFCHIYQYLFEHKSDLETKLMDLFKQEFYDETSCASFFSGFCNFNFHIIRASYCEIGQKRCVYESCCIACKLNQCLICQQEA